MEPPLTKKIRSETGEDWSALPAEEGVSHLKIKAENPGIVVGTLPHWQADLDKRVKTVAAFAQRSFMNRAAAILGKKIKNAHPSVTCEEISRFHPVKSVQESVTVLKSNPTNHEARVNIVGVMSKAGRTFPLEVYRAIMMQSMLANSLGEFSIIGLKLAVWSQSNYLHKLQVKVKEEHNGLKRKLEASDGSAYERQKANVQKIIKKMETNIRMITAYQAQTAKAAEDTKYKIVGEFSIETLRGSAGEGNKGDKQKALLASATAVVHYMRFLPLMHPLALEIGDAVILMDRNMPLGYFLKARVMLMDLLLSIARYQAGVRDIESVAKVQNLFKETYHQYGLAVSKTGDGIKKGTDLSIVLEYASTVRYFYRSATDVLKIKLPRPWVDETLNRTRTILIRAGSEHPKVSKLVQQLENDLNFEGISITQV